MSKWSSREVSITSYKSGGSNGVGGMYRRFVEGTRSHCPLCNLHFFKAWLNGDNCICDKWATLLLRLLLISLQAVICIPRLNRAPAQEEQKLDLLNDIKLPAKATANMQRVPGFQIMIKRRRRMCNPKEPFSAISKSEVRSSFRVLQQPIICSFLRCNCVPSEFHNL